MSLFATGQLSILVLICSHRVVNPSTVGQIHPGTKATFLHRSYTRARMRPAGWAFFFSFFFLCLERLCIDQHFTLIPLLLRNAAKHGTDFMLSRQTELWCWAKRFSLFWAQHRGQLDCLLLTNCQEICLAFTFQWNTSLWKEDPFLNAVLLKKSSSAIAVEFIVFFWSNFIR